MWRLLHIEHESNTHSLIPDQKGSVEARKFLNVCSVWSGEGINEIYDPVKHSYEHIPETETTTPKKTRKMAGSFSRLNKEEGSSFMNIKPGKIYERGIAVNNP